MDSDKIKELINEALLNDVRSRLNQLHFKDEDEFVSKILEIGQPIWEITQKGKQDLFKQPNREMFTVEDISETVTNIEATKAQRIYIVGNVGSGKSTFARELAGQTNFKNIDLDHFFQIYRQEKNKEANLSELLSFVLEREDPPYIINHADLLSHNLSDKADMVILLNPKKEEQMKSRQIRKENKADGEWQNVSVDDYDRISQSNLDSLAKTKGKVVYNNDKSGILVKSLEK
jgi:adenylate kinase family enzyme